MRHVNFSCYKPSTFFANLRCKKGWKLLYEKNDPVRVKSQMYYSLHRTPSKISCLPISGVSFFYFAFSHSLNDSSWYVSCWLQMFGIVVVSCSQMYAILKFRHFHSLIKKTKIQCNFKSTIFCNVLLLLLWFRKSRGDLRQRTGKNVFIYDRSKTV